MANMSDIRYHPLPGLDEGGGAGKTLPPSLDKKDMEGYPFWLEEIVSGSFRLCSAEAVPGKGLEDIGINCPNCGRLLKAISRHWDGKIHALYICADCREG